MQTKFYSERSIYFLLVVLIIPTAVFIYAKVKYENISLILVILSLITLVNLYLLFFTYFLVDKEKLTIKVGFFTYKTIYLKDIKSIKRDKSLTKSLSGSMKNRIEIFYADSSVIISVKNLNDFLKLIANYNVSASIPSFVA